MKLIAGIARRQRGDFLSPAELDIRQAMRTVEETGCDVRLTDALILLGKAKDKVADFIDAQPETPGIEE